VTEAFEEHRALLFAVAYRMLGAVADAEDIVQDAWLRWSAADHAKVADPRAYLIRIVTNTAIDRLRSVRVRRESYVGPWLPEPILTSPDVAEDVELAESVSLAMLVVLETLTPLERAVFVLREVFDMSHAEIASTLDRTEVSVRQTASRARRRVAERRPRYATDRAEQRRVTEEFLAATVGGDMDRLMAVLAPGVVLISDGGGKRKAAPRPIEGAAKVARWLAGIRRTPYYDGVPVPEMELRLAEINGAPGAVFYGRGKVLTVLAPEVSDGRVAVIRLVANPDKLRAVERGPRASGEPSGASPTRRAGRERGRPRSE
jgi:RNA polymerase sigma-70 factor (TIGR02957 family)